MTTFDTVAILTYFGQSNFAGKIIILVLMGFSLLAWTVMIGKFLDLKKLRTANASFERTASQVPLLLQIDASSFGKQWGEGPFSFLVSEAITAFHRYQAEPEQQNRTIDALQLRMGHVENALQRAVAEQTMKYETKMVLLGSIVTGAPFLGLLGTVWGVMDAFGSISQSSATLQTLAPGVSGALLTTVAGLLVAIPSVFGYNFLLTSTKLAITELENFASTVADRIELEAHQIDI
ncbi:MAG: MotA/TolQ/ExbB proton channel family protein [Opitutales bacterium]|nr:MotA/TolQ/ExbB proton channel family protein [Opitutales bacterium]NRA28302.1 MotA/TolQ/ExbB proton channel family protein [Opitutales bacterium]